MNAMFHTCENAYFAHVSPASEAQLINQADNAALVDSGLPYRFSAALRLIKSLGLSWGRYAR